MTRLFRPLAAFFIFSFAVTGLSISSSWEKVRGKGPEDLRPDVEPSPILSAVPVSELPELDGDYDDEEWRDAPVLQVGAMRFRAVYTEEHVAFLMKWMDRDLKMSSSGSWVWDDDA